MGIYFKKAVYIPTYYNEQDYRIAIVSFASIAEVTGIAKEMNLLIFSLYRPSEGASRV